MMEGNSGVGPGLRPCDHTLTRLRA